MYIVELFIKWLNKNKRGTGANPENNLKEGVNINREGDITSEPNEDEALTLTDKVMQVTVDKKYTEHHHDRDRSLGVSPHVFKCTKYEGQLYDFGKAIVNGFTPI